MEIGRKDIFWNYFATFLKIASSALLLPFILKMMPSETVAIWTVFITLTSLTALFDFGFNQSFTRNVTYVFSGVKKLHVKGFESIYSSDTIDYGLLKGLIDSMRWFYKRIALIAFFLLISVGTYYIHSLLSSYQGSLIEVYISWLILCLLTSYNLYTLYYDSLLQGKGMVKRSKQVIIIGHSIYLIIASIFVLNGFGLIAIVAAQASSIIIIRILSYYLFFTLDIKQNLNDAEAKSQKDIIKAIYPNAIKMGFTSLGGFMITKSATIIGSLYLTLEEIASYGITMQIIGVLAALSSIFTATYQPKIVQLRVANKLTEIKNLYLKGELILIFTYLIGCIAIIYLGPFAFNIIESKTLLMPTIITALAIITSMIETNISIAGGILLTKNEVPFFRASLISGALIIVGLIIAFKFFNTGLITLVFVPLIIDLSYQAWKWPLEVKRDLNIKFI